MAPDYVNKKIYMICIFFLVLSGLNWGTVAVFKKDVLSALTGKNTVAMRFCYMLFAVSAIVVGILSISYFPFLGEVEPCSILNQKNTTTCVSCYYKIKNKYGGKYNEWFKNTLAINCPYVFFSNKEGIEFIKQYRRSYPTYYIELDFENFYTYKFKDKMLTHPVDCPSVELNMVWNEKLFMIEKAHALNPFNSDWFKWIDAGIVNYRDTYPPQSAFPNVDKLNKLPQDKFIYSSSEPYNAELVTNTNYYHHISGTYIIHKNVVNRFATIYKTYMEKLVDRNNVWTDQVILTHIYKDQPDLFFKLCDGYGEITKSLM